MGTDSKIEWCDHTFNPWIGCTKVSPGCANCYAETLMDKRHKRVVWGSGNPRQRTSAANWELPGRWDRKAKMLGVRYRVFCASLADVFDKEVSDFWRNDLFEVIEHTPNLDWLLLTKRPENVAGWIGEESPNIWLGVSVENQAMADKRIPLLLKLQVPIRFLSVEPLLEPIDLNWWLHHLDWVIVGGESGPGARPMMPDWVRQIRDDCALCSNTPFFFKQWGGPNKKASGRLLDGREWNQIPVSKS